MADDTITTSPPISDAELLQRHLNGDKTAFADIVRRYHKPLFNFLFRMTNNRALADDVFQETFLQLHISAPTFDPKRRLKPWLFTIAANKARDALRSRRRKQAAPLDAKISHGQNDSATSFADLLPADVPGPEENLANRETQRIVESIVEQMPDNLKEVLLLNYFQDFSYNQVAETLEVPLGTVKSRLHAAVKHLAEKWKALQKQTTHETP